MKQADLRKTPSLRFALHQTVSLSITRIWIIFQKAGRFRSLICYGLHE